MRSMLRVVIEDLQRRSDIDLAVRWALKQHHYFSGLPPMFFARQLSDGRSIPPSFLDLVRIHMRYGLS